MAHAAPSFTSVTPSRSVGDDIGTTIPGAAIGVVVTGAATTVACARSVDAGAALPSWSIALRRASAPALGTRRVLGQLQAERPCDVGGLPQLPLSPHGLRREPEPTPVGESGPRACPRRVAREPESLGPVDGRRRPGGASPAHRPVLQLLAPRRGQEAYPPERGRLPARGRLPGCRPAILRRRVRLAHALGRRG